MAVQEYIRERFFPQMWCEGCGHGTILNSLLRAIEDLGIAKSDIVMTSGIGCSARISGYVDFHSLHTMHGRALACATGVKMAKPALNVIVPMGDGDALAIGGNHFIHACRRNIDITAIVMNNRIYGMTGGQYSPLSGVGTMATTAPYSSIDNAFDVAELAKAAGATFVARTTTYHVAEAVTYLKKAIQHKGFSVVEIMTQCPTYYGRKNKKGDAVEMLKWFKESTAKLGSKELENNPSLIARGIFADEDKPEYCSEYNKIIERASRR
ncbi:2-oxoacid:ferredoxin oxidoreductase subunit beta [Desulforhopalus vacuolatus]|uniref:2-oxoacid:ferredoxin oxidoreductase subunit beta n=1 Tax=Desulforhopalus vacuolatus TaxID=40414 RepID=UPI001962C36C|nr:2-oxoacid:ferredoxin oxidoreductase subunit beta [Desulforhopalus vacuolatus]MBM9519219.1 2-oxoacid:ferredoxin oxidoreductase subunit beta [Desulforhopalus vacuolatus]